MTVRRRLAWSFYPYIVILIVAVAFGTGAFAFYSLHIYHISRATADLELRARVAIEEIPVDLIELPNPEIREVCETLSNRLGMRLTIVGASGRVIADSDIRTGSEVSAETGPGAYPIDSSDIESQSYRPEIRTALNGMQGVSRRYSTGLREEVLFVALPIRQGAQIIGAARVSAPIWAFAPDYRVLQWRLIAALIGAVGLATLVTYLLSRRVSYAIDSMQSGAERFAAGDFSQPLALPPNKDLAGLAEALNRMAGQLDEKIRTITRQRNDQDAILSSLRESVIAVDTNERVLFMNRAAANLLDVDPVRFTGRMMPEIARNSQLLNFVSEQLHRQTDKDTAATTLRLRLDTVLQVSGTPLTDATGATIGLLIVMNDITRLQQLENVRKDFVANVSHELKTPVTAIKGFVETLMDGAVEDELVARDMLSRVAHNAERLNAIIDDLLSLSRIEQEGEQGAIQLVSGSLGSIAAAAISQCELKAKERSIQIDLICEHDVVTRVNALLLEQAVGNLLDNAIKYSSPGGKVLVTVSASESGATVAVRDFGNGIPPEHLPRIFERFYRVDKARSRKLGGTGLGLAIVKHIANAHGGNVTVKSVVGEGSEFTINLPGLSRTFAD